MPAVDPKTKQCRFQLGTLFCWFLVHAAIVPVLAFFIWPPASHALPWLIFSTVVLSPLYVIFVHEGDSRWKMGGVLSIRRWLIRRVATGEGPRLLPRLTGDITTGFAVLLAFQMLRFHRDLSKDQLLTPFLNCLLAVIATLFLISFISNLVQIAISQWLAQPIWDREQQDAFRRILRVLRTLIWHCLLTPVILMLCLVPYPWVWICLAVNFLYGLSLNWYYFSAKIPEGYPQ